AVVGGVVERGTSIPALTGLYVFGDFSEGTHGRLFYAGLDNNVIEELGIDQPANGFDLYLKGFGQDDGGEGYVLAGRNVGPSGKAGVVYRLMSIVAAPAILNLSTRLKVETGENVLIGGFIVTGSYSQQVVLRGLGPSLSDNGVPVNELLSNPKIELHDSTGA